MRKEVKSKIYSLALLLGAIKFNNKNSKVLYYHDVHEDGDVPETVMSTPMSLFKKHIEIIKGNGFEIVREVTKPKGQVMLTFDDGYLGVLKNRTYFEENGLKPTIFIITSRIGKPNFMSVENIKSLAKSGFIFQSHTHTHPDLNLCTAVELEDEFIKSKTLLSELLSKEVNAICFPKGFFNDQTISVARQSGYKKLYSSIPGSYLERNAFGVICRNLVQFSSPADFKNTLFGGMTIFKKRYTNQHYHE
ncbi:hypothetical protein EZJ43_01075 [Pedobacter changchengzhani]|uniref:NodB homology domain-containing protein n=1 Tax=Pedobacter changchengzhani TaxID=2529274 RepID=A0A4R5MPD6_9SPHI|nr:polysaccharide deacetylase family protein [Pedobacter changchengzhani]TDG37717.1 hypothetical protein EZJ43_01075 [Pedobacter changchengzhani]